MNNNLSLQLFNRLTSYIHNNTTWEFKLINSHIYIRNKQLKDLKEFKRFYTYPIEINNNVNLEDELNYFLIGGIIYEIKNNEIRQQSLIETLHNLQNYNNMSYTDLQCKDLINLLVPIFNNYNRNNSTLEELAMHLDLMGI